MHLFGLHGAYLMNTGFMPIKYDILTSKSLVIGTYSGVLHTDTAVQHVIDLFNRADFHPHFDVLEDLSRITHADISYGRMIEMISKLEPMLQRRAPDARSAFFAPNDAIYGLTRMYQQTLKSIVVNETGVFRDRREALAFLGHRETTLRDFFA